VAAVLGRAADDEDDRIQHPRGLERGCRRQQSNRAKDVDLVGRRGRLASFGNEAHAREMKDHLGTRLLDRAAEGVGIADVAVTPLDGRQLTRREDARHRRMEPERDDR